jgi:hypothetical protein
MLPNFLFEKAHVSLIVCALISANPMIALADEVLILCEGREQTNGEQCGREECSRVAWRSYLVDDGKVTTYPEGREVVEDTENPEDVNRREVSEITIALLQVRFVNGSNLRDPMSRKELIINRVTGVVEEFMWSDLTGFYSFSGVCSPISKVPKF